jgi:hypothetical protein
MPLLSRLMIRTALLHLALGFLLGTLILWHKGRPIHPLIWALLPAHIQLLLVGWTLQLALGVAFWILPRFVTRIPPPGSNQFAWASYLLLNTGLWLVILASLLPFSPLGTRLPWLSPLGGLLELLAVLAFLAHAWPRIKPFAEVVLPEKSVSDNG